MKTRQTFGRKFLVSVCKTPMALLVDAVHLLLKNDVGVRERAFLASSCPKYSAGPVLLTLMCSK